MWDTRLNTCTCAGVKVIVSIILLFMSFDGAKIHFFPDIPAVSAEILALRGWEGEKKMAAVRLPWLSGPPSLPHKVSDTL